MWCALNHRSGLPRNRPYWGQSQLNERELITVISQVIKKTRSSLSVARINRPSTLSISPITPGRAQFKENALFSLDAPAGEILRWAKRRGLSTKQIRETTLRPFRHLVFISSLPPFSSRIFETIRGGERSEIAHSLFVSLFHFSFYHLWLSRLSPPPPIFICSSRL